MASQWATNRAWPAWSYPAISAAGASSPPSRVSSCAIQVPLSREPHRAAPAAGGRCRAGAGRCRPVRLAWSAVARANRTGADGGHPGRGRAAAGRDAFATGVVGLGGATAGIPHRARQPISCTRRRRAPRPITGARCRVVTDGRRPQLGASTAAICLASTGAHRTSSSRVYDGQEATWRTLVSPRSPARPVGSVRSNPHRCYPLVGLALRALVAGGVWAVFTVEEDGGACSHNRRAPPLRERRSFHYRVRLGLRVGPAWGSGRASAPPVRNWSGGCEPLAHVVREDRR
jgi:hypothetical protein